MHPNNAMSMPDEMSSIGKALWKTRMCSHWTQNKCRYGDECVFAHGEGELLASPPNAVALKRRMRLLKQGKSTCSTHSGCSNEPAARSHENALLKSSMASSDGPAWEEPCPRRLVNQQPFRWEEPVRASVEQTPDRGHGSRMTPHMVIQEMHYLSSLDEDVLRDMLESALPQLYED